MVANPQIERPGSVDFLINELNALKRQVSELTAQSKFPFSVGHNGVTDFSILPSASGDGSADLFVGNGLGDPLLRVFTDATYDQKIAALIDYQGNTLVSTDASAGFGLGNPCLPFLFGGYEQLNLTGAITAGTATEIGSGHTYAFNPCLWATARIRVTSSTAVTVKVFAAFTGAATTHTTTERTITCAAGGTAIQYLDFATYLASGDMKEEVQVQFRAYCSSGTAANANLTLVFNRGMGISKGFVDQSLQAAL